jgi:hypothetical protein
MYDSLRQRTILEVEMKILAILLLCIGWYGPGGGALRTQQPKKVVEPKTTATYHHYRGLNELKIKAPTRSRTYRWRGPPNHGWLRNPYVK